MSINSAVADLLNVPKAPQDQEPEPFQFSQELDSTGLLYESPLYVKANCNQCYGRGYLTSLVGDGYRWVATEDGANRKKLLARNLVTCLCVRRTYSRIAKNRNKEMPIESKL